MACDPACDYLRFKSDRLNRIKIFSELQIFAVLLISVVLQSYQADFSTEVIGFDGYGIVLVPPRDLPTVLRTLN